MNRKYEKLGTFIMTSPIMRATDPCYDNSVWCYGTISNCLTGCWEAAVTYRDEAEFGSRVMLLAARHISSGRTFAKCNQVWMDEESIYYKGNWEPCSFELGVDSGQAGLFDDAHYQEDTVFNGAPEPNHNFGSVWYNHCCDLTLGDRQAGVIPYGTVASSGYGDGCYAALQHKNRKGQVDCIVILFLPEQKKEA